MLPQKKRLSTFLVEKVLKKGLLIHGKCFFIRALVVPEEKNSRFAVVVSKKIFPTAVARNTVRRQVYTILGKQEVVRTPVQAALVAKKSAEKLSFAELAAEIDDILLKLKKEAK
jgi:ribonuclease P protein component